MNEIITLKDIVEEKLPRNISKNADGGVLGCPSDLGYQDLFRGLNVVRCCDNKQLKNIDTSLVCELCWKQKAVKKDNAEAKQQNKEHIKVEHYNNGDVECIEAIAEATKNLNGAEAFITGNIIKYAWRWKEKGKENDLNKIINYTKMLLEYLHKDDE